MSLRENLLHLQRINVQFLAITVSVNMCGIFYLFLWNVHALTQRINTCAFYFRTYYICEKLKNIREIEIFFVIDIELAAASYQPWWIILWNQDTRMTQNIDQIARNKYEDFQCIFQKSYCLILTLYAYYNLMSIIHINIVTVEEQCEIWNP